MIQCNLMILFRKITDVFTRIIHITIVFENRIRLNVNSMNSKYYYLALYIVLQRLKPDKENNSSDIILNRIDFNRTYLPPMVNYTTTIKIIHS